LGWLILVGGVVGDFFQAGDEKGFFWLVMVGQQTNFWKK
jgi:hypothetical protein